MFTSRCLNTDDTLCTLLVLWHNILLALVATHSEKKRLSRLSAETCALQTAYYVDKCQTEIEVIEQLQANSYFCIL